MGSGEAGRQRWEALNSLLPGPTALRVFRARMVMLEAVVMATVTSGLGYSSGGPQVEFPVLIFVDVQGLKW